MLSKFDEVLDKLNQDPSLSLFPAAETTDTSRAGDTSQPQRTVRSKRTFEMKKSCTTDELAPSSVTGLIDDQNKLSEFFWQVCLKDVSVLIHGSSEILRPF